MIDSSDYVRIPLRIVYHRQKVDDELAADILRALESAFSRLTEESDWSAVLYLFYAPTDSRAFNLWEARRELKKRVAELFLAEARRDYGESLDVKEVNDLALSRWNYSLEIVSPDHPYRCRLRGYSGLQQSAVTYYADVDIYLIEAAPGVTASGRFSTQWRALPVVADREKVCCILTARGNTYVSPHVDLSQRFIRGRQNQIYITGRQRQVLVGPTPYCDLVDPSLSQPVRISTDENMKGLNGNERDNDARAERQFTDFGLEFLNAGNAESERDNRFLELLRVRAEVRDYSLQAVARVIPREAGGGSGAYGADWCHLGLTLSRPVLVSLPLGDNGAIGVDKNAKVFVWNKADRHVEPISASGQHFRVGSQLYRWEADNNNLFYGFIYFEDEAARLTGKRRVTVIPAELSLDGVIARGAGFGKLAQPLLPDYREDELVSQSGSLALSSDGEGRFEISLADSSSRHKLFIVQPEAGRRYHAVTPENGGTITASAPFSFIFGSTWYRVGIGESAYYLRPHWSGKYQVLEPREHERFRDVARPR